MRLPSTSLYGGDRVYVIAKDRLSERTVDVVGAAGKDILVRGGIEAGERVITTRLSNAGEGVKVRELGLERAGVAAR